MYRIIFDTWDVIISYQSDLRSRDNCQLRHQDKTRFWKERRSRKNVYSTF